jgi:predicted AAA+ superfamily ATPase
MELKAYLSYLQRRKTLRFWRSINKQEVDFLIDDEIAIEVKSTRKILPKHLIGIRALKDEKLFRKFYVISEDRIERVSEGVSIMHWTSFLKAFGKGKSSDVTLPHS